MNLGRVDRLDVDWLLRLAASIRKHFGDGGGLSDSAETGEVAGAAPMAVVDAPVERPQAEEMRRWGVDPALGRTLIDGLSDAFRVVAFDYEGHTLRCPSPTR